MVRGMDLRTGFTVVYQWRLKSGMEEQFLEAWRELTENLKLRGARGSRLHRTEDGSLLAYAQWTDKQAWERSCALHELDQALSQRMLDAAEDTWPPMLLTVIADLFVTEAQSASAHVTH